MNEWISDFLIRAEQFSACSSSAPKYIYYIVQCSGFWYLVILAMGLDGRAMVRAVRRIAAASPRGWRQADNLRSNIVLYPLKRSSQLHILSRA